MERTKLTVTVLSEGPIPTEDLAEIVREGDVGAYVLTHEVASQEQLTDEQMADALRAAGSEPGFFSLD